MKKKHYATKKSQIRNFRAKWESIEKMIKMKKEKSEHDYFEESKPTFQEMLADPNQISRKLIDYSNYTQVSWDELNYRSSFDCFHGILFYIFYNSEGKFNVNELEIHFSGANIIQYLNQQQFKIPKITNLYDFNDITKEFKSSSIKDAFFGIKFLRIKINPIAYAVRIGNSGNAGYNFTSHKFMGLNEKTNEWEILDERCNSNDLIATNSFMLYYTKSTNEYYTAFKIQQTDTGNRDFWGYSIKNFEIHGYVAYLSFTNIQIFEEEKESTFDNYEEVNPSMDMNDYLF